MLRKIVCVIGQISLVNIMAADNSLSGSQLPDYFPAKYFDLVTYLFIFTFAHMFCVCRVVDGFSFVDLTICRDIAIVAPFMFVLNL
jgi:hypothetical protein